jgi:hypothetical protein
MSFVMDGNKQEGNIVECRALRWANVSSALPRITLTGFHGIWDDYDIAFTIIVILK